MDVVAKKKRERKMYSFVMYYLYASLQSYRKKEPRDLNFMIFWLDTQNLTNKLR